MQIPHLNFNILKASTFLEYLPEEKKNPYKTAMYTRVGRKRYFSIYLLSVLKTFIASSYFCCNIAEYYIISPTD